MSVELRNRANFERYRDLHQTFQDADGNTRIDSPLGKLLVQEKFNLQLKGHLLVAKARLFLNTMQAVDGGTVIFHRISLDEDDTLEHQLSRKLTTVAAYKGSALAIPAPTPEAILDTAENIILAHFQLQTGSRKVFAENERPPIDITPAEARGLILTRR